MKIAKINIMRGPNCWSPDEQRLIVLKIEEDNTPGLFFEYNEELMAVLAQLHIPSQFLNTKFTLFHLVGYVAAALQRLAGIRCNYLTSYSNEFWAEKRAVFPYEVEDAGVYAAYAAVKLVNNLTYGMPSAWETEVREIDRLARQERLGPSTKAIADAAAVRQIPVTRLDDDSLIMLGYGVNQHIIRAAVASSTSAIAVELAQDKDSTKKILGRNYIPIPYGVIIDQLDELMAVIDELQFPLVIKPADGNHGRGITTMIRSYQDAVKAFQLAQQISDDVIVERHIFGNDYRFLVINFRLVAVAQRTPAMVIGDGTATVAELVREINKDPRRGAGHEQVLTEITLDDDSLAILATLDLTPESVPAKGRTIFLKSTANLSTGGTAEDVTDMVHPDNKALAERIARLMDLDICGIDVMASTVSEPVTEANGAVLEVNAGPGLRMHLAPSTGKPRDVGSPIVEMLFPGAAPARIPLVAITGTNGKTTTTRLIAHLAGQAGYHTGFTTTDGIYINGRLISEGDCSGPQSARVILRDPLVDFAVLECARGGILRSGLGFDKCDIGIVTNISADHLGLEGIHSVEQLARIKAVVPQSVSTSGYAILNADDDLVYGMKDIVRCKVALFSLYPDNSRILQHMAEGEPVAFMENGSFVFCRGKEKVVILEISAVPLTFDGTAEFMIKNILPAILAGFIAGIPLEHIRSGLISFMPSPENTPGRINSFDFGNFKLIIDYAHNEGGYAEIKKYAEKLQASIKTGIIAATGDRRDIDIKNLGRLAAEIFDQLIIRHDKDGRGRANEEITGLLIEGMRQVKPDMPLRIISDEIEAVEFAMKHAQQNEWIFVSTDDVRNTIAYVTRAHENKTMDYAKSPFASG